MTMDGERDFYRAIKQGAFPPVYYLHGENDFLKQGAVRDLLASAVDASTRDFNLDQIDAASVGAEALESLLRTPPMLATRRVIVVRHVQDLKREAREALERYLRHPASDTLLVLVDDHDAKTDRALTDVATSVEFGPLSPERLLRWVRHYASTFGTPIDDDAATLLVRAVGDDLPQLAAELEKLSNFAGPTGITAAAVSTVVGVRHGETMADLLDAVADRDVTKAMSLLDHVLEQPKTGAVPILMALTAQTLGMAWGRAARASGTPEYQLQREFFALLKEGRAFPGRPWGEAVKTWSRALHRWDDASLQRAMDILLDADRAAKETRLSSEEQLLRNVVLSLCADAGSIAA